eukprot:3582973-Prymnesium_polylepis.1
MYGRSAPLPPCAWRQSVAQSRAELGAQLTQLARELADAIKPLLRDSSGDRDVPFALFGFSFGALL